MGLVDRVKAQAAQLAQQAQEAAQEGKSRLDQAQAARRGDTLLRQLGALVYAERTGRGTADSQARIDQLISDISAYESQNGLNLADQPPSGFGQSLFGQPSAGPGPQGQSSGSGQSAFGQQSPDQQPPPGFPPSPHAGAAQADTPPGGASTMPPVDRATNFFPAPDDEAP